MRCAGAYAGCAQLHNRLGTLLICYASSQRYLPMGLKLEPLSCAMPFSTCYSAPVSKTCHVSGKLVCDTVPASDQGKSCKLHRLYLLPHPYPHAPLHNHHTLFSSCRTPLCVASAAYPVCSQALWLITQQHWLVAQAACRTSSTWTCPSSLKPHTP